MVEEISEEEIFANDKDPEEAIAEIRREEAKEEEETDSSKEEETETVAEGTEETEEETEAVEEVVDAETDTTDVVDDETSSEHTQDTGEDEETIEEQTSTEETEEVKKHNFRANGKDFEFTEPEIMEQFEGVFGKAMDYTQKMQKIAPFRKMISALEEQGISESQLNMALDLLKGDKEAIKQLAKEKDIDLGDLDYEEETSSYTPGNYGKNETQIKIDEIEATISKDPEYTTTIDIIDEQWDDGSRKLIADNPEIILGLHNDVKSGVYDKVAPEAAKLQMLDVDGNSKSSLDYYLLAGTKLKESLETENSQEKVDKLNKDAQEAEDKFSKESSKADTKRAATTTGSRSGQKSVVDYLDDDDEKFDAWYKKLEQAT